MRTNEEWVHELGGSGAVQEQALADLRVILLRAVLYLFNRNLNDLSGRTREEILPLAEDCAQDALIAILRQLPEFRGDSKFTTWAYKFAINIGLTTARRERWKTVSLDQLSQADGELPLEWAFQDKSSDGAPEQSAQQGEIREVIQQVIEHDLTEKQRYVLTVMVFKRLAGARFRGR
jgi:RNA polymerase sigma-70 factor (ECF subfamily)